MKRFFFIALIGLYQVPIWASSADSTSADTGFGTTPDVTGMVVRMVLSLGVVLLLIWGAVYLLQHLSGKGIKQKSANSFIRVLDRTYLSPKKAIYVIQIGSRSLAVGVTDHQMTPLIELSSEEILTAYPTPIASNGMPSFANLLKDMKTKFSGGQIS